MSAPIGCTMKTLQMLRVVKRLPISFAKYSTLRKTVSELLSKDSQILECARVEGWVKSVRPHRDVIFMHLNDGSTCQYLQIVAEPHLCSNVSFGSCVIVTGELVKSPAKGQEVELLASKVEVVGVCNQEEYPIQAKTSHTPNYMKEILHLRPRTNFFSSLLRVRNAATIAIHKYFQENGFYYIHTPILTSNDCEGAGEVFSVEPVKKELLNSLSLSDDEDGDDEDKCEDGQTHQFFQNPAYLTVSGQLHLEAIIGGFKRVYNFGPTFRAENSITRHHLSEFYMVEGEIAFTESLDDIIKIMEDLVKYTTKEILDKAEEDVHYFINKKHVHKLWKLKGSMETIDTLINKPFNRMTYTEAVDLLMKNNEKFRCKVEWGSDLKKEHEKYLVNSCGNTPVFVTDYPISLKPFYSRVNDDQQTVSAVDLLVPEVGELIGGTLREERYDVLKEILVKAQLTENLKWYLDLREFGSAPHGGFGMGFERYIQCLLGIQNIRDTIPFPRWPRHCKL